VLTVHVVWKGTCCGAVRGAGGGVGGGADDLRGTCAAAMGGVTGGKVGGWVRLCWCVGTASAPVLTHPHCKCPGTGPVCGVVCIPSWAVGQVAHRVLSKALYGCGWWDGTGVRGAGLWCEQCMYNDKKPCPERWCGPVHSRGGGADGGWICRGRGCVGAAEGWSGLPPLLHLKAYWPSCCGSSSLLCPPCPYKPPAPPPPPQQFPSRCRSATSMSVH
jgi:hypothetical protein